MTHPLKGVAEAVFPILLAVCKGFGVVAGPLEVVDVVASPRRSHLTQLLNPGPVLRNMIPDPSMLIGFAGIVLHVASKSIVIVKCRPTVGTLGSAIGGVSGRLKLVCHGDWRAWFPHGGGCQRLAGAVAMLRYCGLRACRMASSH